MEKDKDLEQKSLVRYRDPSTGASSGASQSGADFSASQFDSAARQLPGIEGSRAIYIVIAALVLVLSVAGIIVLSSGEKITAPTFTNCGSISTSSKIVSKLLGNFCSGNQDLKSSALQLISEAQDERAKLVMQLLSKGTASPQRNTIVEGYQQWLIKSGHGLLADVFGKWLKEVSFVGAAEGDSTVALALAATEPKLSASERSKRLQELAAVNQMLALQIAVAIQVESSDAEISQIVTEMLVEQTGDQTIRERSPVAAILSNKVLSTLFGPTVAVGLDSLSDEEILWLLPRISEHDALTASEVATRALSRRLVVGFNRVFLKTIVEGDSFRNPPEVLKALIGASMGALEENDMLALGRWLSVDSDEVMMAICTLHTGEESGDKAFDILAGRTLTKEPGKSMMRWVLESHWEKRRELSKAICTLGLLDQASQEQFEESINKILSYADSGQLLEAALSSKDERLSVAMVRGVGAITPSKRLVELLYNESEDIRFAAVAALEGRNNLDVLQQITRAYEREKSPRVREQYEKIHWVVKDRKAASAAK